MGIEPKRVGFQSPVRSDAYDAIDSLRVNV
jgi:hypothetical protein